MVSVCPRNGHRKGNSKGSFSMHCPTPDAECLDLHIFCHKDTRVFHYLVAPLGCSVRATASNKGGAVKCRQLGWDHLANDTAQRPFAFTWTWKATSLPANTKAYLVHTNDPLMRHFTFHYWTSDPPIVQTLIFPSTVQPDTPNKPKHSAQESHSADFPLLWKANPALV